MTNAIAEGVTTAQLLAPADQVVELLPDYAYKHNYQPDWPDMGAVAGAIHELRDTEMVTTPRHVDALQSQLAAIVTGDSEQVIGMTGRCADRLRISRRMQSMRDLGRVTLELASGVLKEREVVQSAGNYFHISRQFNFAKPRSEEMEAVKTRIVESRRLRAIQAVGLTAVGLARRVIGDKKPLQSADAFLNDLGSEGPPVYVASWQGDNVNGQEVDNRTPEPSNMVSAVLQSRDVAAKQTELAGEHIPTAHELLLLPAEIGMLREDPETGQLYSLAADMLWVGVRTNDPDSPQVQLASMIANPVGVKLGPGTTPDLVAALNEKLNPESVPGRLTFMIRMGLNQIEDMDTTLAAIAKFAPNSVIIYDPHGSTEKIDGVKVRTVSKVIDEIKLLASLCHKHKLPLHGALLETMPDDARQECLNYPGEMAPAKLARPDVDPLFAPRQFRRIYKAIAPILGRGALAAAVAA